MLPTISPLTSMANDTAKKLDELELNERELRTAAAREPR